MSKILLKVIAFFIGCISLVGFTLHFTIQSDWAKQELQYFKQVLKPEKSFKSTKKSMPVKKVKLTNLYNEPPLKEPKNTIKPHKILKKTVLINKNLQFFPRRQIKLIKKKLTLKSKVVIPPAKKYIHKKNLITNHAQNGFDAYRNKDFKRAIAEFSAHLKVMPTVNNMNIHIQKAYAHQAIGEKKEAIFHFKKSIDQQLTPQAHLQNEIRYLNNIWDFNHHIIWRNHSNHKQILGRKVLSSGSFTRLSYKPDFINKPEITLFTRLMSSLDHNMSKSYQASLGISLKPLKKHNFIISFERLFKIGEFARNDWMARASYSFAHNMGYVNEPKMAYSIYLDAALIGIKSKDISFTAIAAVGYALPYVRNLIVRPEIKSILTLNHDKYYKCYHYELSTGISGNFYFNESKYESHRSYISLAAHYNFKIFGNSLTSSGPSLSVSFHF